MDSRCFKGKGYGRKYGEPRRKAQERVRASGTLACMSEGSWMSARHAHREGEDGGLQHRASVGLRPGRWAIVCSIA